jgi:hypothetical protein
MKTLAAVGVALGILGLGNTAGATQPKTCAQMQQIFENLNIVVDSDGPYLACPPSVPSTAFMVAPFGEGATGWGGRTSALGSPTEVASFGLLWHGYEYNVYETLTRTFTTTVEWTVPAGAPVATLVAHWAQDNYVSGVWNSINGLVVPNYGWEPKI